MAFTTNVTRASLLAVHFHVHDFVRVDSRIESRDGLSTTMANKSIIGLTGAKRGQFQGWRVWDSSNVTVWVSVDLVHDVFIPNPTGIDHKYLHVNQNTWKGTFNEVRTGTQKCPSLANGTQPSHPQTLTLEMCMFDWENEIHFRLEQLYNNQGYHRQTDNLPLKIWLEDGAHLEKQAVPGEGLGKQVYSGFIMT